MARRISRFNYDDLCLTIDEQTRNGLVECGYVNDMMSLNERLPAELVLWFLEHGTTLSSFANYSCF